jgi:SARP family transcriptional regulator, regulator of embCAB operon
MVASGIGFGVLGPLQMSVDGKLVSLGGRKQRAVLAMLVVNRNRPVGIDRLIDAVWGEWPPPGVRASLHAYVSKLRRLFGSAGADSGAALASAPPGYRLPVAKSACDSGRFISEKVAGVRAASTGQFEEASRRLSAALAEWRGQVLEDLCDFEFVQIVANALVEEKLLAHTARAEAEIACGRGDAVIGELESLIEEHPYREPLWAQLISAYYVAKRQTEALETYRRLNATLSRDLGIDPDPSIQALHERILRQEPLDVKKRARRSAVRTLVRMDRETAEKAESSVAQLRDAAGRAYPLRGLVTRIGRHANNDIVLDTPEVSRYHAAITDTGTGFVITDLRSANGVMVQDRRIRGGVILSHGDHIHICDHLFTFEIPTAASEDRSESRSERRVRR